jgi:hypothetical protein
MSKPRDWQDQYYDGDDMIVPEVSFVLLDEDGEVCDDELIELLSLLADYPEEGADEYSE